MVNGNKIYDFRDTSVRERLRIALCVLMGWKFRVQKKREDEE